MKATVLLSGGQDSATCLAWALNNFSSVDAISFNYGQRHSKELDAAALMASKAGVPHQVVPVPSLAMTQSALTQLDQSILSNRPDGLPATFVPGRNLLFLTIAASLFDIQEAQIHLITGVCETDYSGYPDCRDETIRALKHALSLGINRPVEIHTPLMHLSKADTVNLAKNLPLGWDLLSLSWTCYNGGDKPCRECPSCLLRIKGFEEAGYDDPANTI